MDETTSREKVLKKLRHALLYKMPNPVKQLDRESPIYADLREDLDINFAQEFTQGGGIFLYCENETALETAIKSLYETRQWSNVHCQDASLQYTLTQAGVPFESNPSTVADMQIGITHCEYLVSRTGSILVSSANGRKMVSLPHTLVVVAYTHQLIYDIEDALQAISLKYGNDLPSMLTFITGPARTFSVEQREVNAGVAVRELFLILIDSSEI